jgi:hypothetical protein
MFEPAGPALNARQLVVAGDACPDKALDLLARRVTTPIWSGCPPAGQSVNAAFYDEPSRTVFLVISQDNKLSLNTFDIQTRQLTTIENLNNFTNNPAILYKDSKGGIWWPARPVKSSDTAAMARQPNTGISLT